MPRKAPKNTKVLFVCIGNSCRSPMAEALARHLAADVIEASSAGTAALGMIAKLTSVALAERGVHIDGQYSKQLQAQDCTAADLIINMTGMPGKTLFDADQMKVEDWDVEDPYGSDLEVYRRIRDDIEERVGKLAKRLRQNHPAPRNAE